MALTLPAATDPIHSRTEVFLTYLEYFRARLAERVAALPDDEARRSRLPSGWTPLELVRHLTFAERRWLEWGFLGRDVPDPWGDRRAGRWHVGAHESAASVLEALSARGRATRAVVEAHDLAEVGRPSPRFEGGDPPTLERILFHLLQEHARHLGHLDVVAELAGGPTGK